MIMTKIDNHNGERRRQGRIEVICGSMFSGKTEELIRRMKRAKFAKQRVEIFKPSIDTRYSDEDVVSHDKNVIHSSLTSATNWQTMVYASLLRASTWTLRVFLSVQSQLFVPLQTR